MATRKQQLDLDFCPNCATVVVLMSDGCYYCQLFEQERLKLESLHKKGLEVHVYEASEVPSALRHYQVKTVPTILFRSPLDGSLYRFAGNTKERKASIIASIAKYYKTSTVPHPLAPKFVVSQTRLAKA